MNATMTLCQLTAVSVLTLSTAFAADTFPTLDDSLADKRIAIVISVGDAALPVEAIRDYFMDRGARVHLLTAPETPVQTLEICQGKIDFVQMVDENQQPMRMGVLRRTNEVAAASYDAVYITAGAETTALAFIESARGAATPIFLGKAVAHWVHEASQVFAN